MKIPLSRVAERSSGPAGEPDAHGQAALLLTESLIHTLIENAAMSNQDAIQVVRSAAEVKVEVATAAGESNKRMKESLKLLDQMRRSLESDEPQIP